MTYLFFRNTSWVTLPNLTRTSGPSSVLQAHRGYGSKSQKPVSQLLLQRSLPFVLMRWNQLLRVPNH